MRSVCSHRPILSSTRTEGLFFGSNPLFLGIQTSEEWEQMVSWLVCTPELNHLPQLSESVQKMSRPPPQILTPITEPEILFPKVSMSLAWQDKREDLVFIPHSHPAPSQAQWETHTQVLSHNKWRNRMKKRVIHNLFRDWISDIES